MPDDGDDSNDGEGVQAVELDSLASAKVDKDGGDSLLENSSEYSDEEFIVRKIPNKKRSTKKSLDTLEARNDEEILLSTERLKKAVRHKKSSKTKTLSEKSEVEKVLTAEKGQRDSKKRKPSS